MSKIINLRNVPEETYRLFKARAQAEGLSLQKFMLQMLRRIAGTPTTEEMRRRMRRLDRQR